MSPLGTVKLLILALVAYVSATDYYVEPAPTSPKLCTLARPCTVNLLPSLTSADTVHFLPATTGTSNTYSIGTRTFVEASIIVDSPLIVLSNTNLRCTFAASFSVNGIRMINGGSLGANGVTTVTIENVNSTDGGYLVLDGQTVSIIGSSFARVTGTNRHVIYATSASLNSVSFSDSRTSTSLLSFQPSLSFTADASVSTDGVSFTNCNTTASTQPASIMTIQSPTGKNINAGSLFTITFTDCNSKGALYLSKCPPVSSTASAFTLTSSLFNMQVSGGSVVKGLIALESSTALGTITHITESLAATGVDFNAGAVYTLTTAGTRIIQNTALSAQNTVCASANLNYIAACYAVGSGATYNDYALIQGAYENVAIGSFLACTNTTLDVTDACSLD